MVTVEMRRAEPAQYDDPSLPQAGDRAFYVISNENHPAFWKKTRGTVTKLHANGRVEFTPDAGQIINRPVSLPRRFQKPFKPDPSKRFAGQYGLTFIE